MVTFHGENRIGKRISEKMERLAQRLSDLDSDETVVRALEEINQSLAEVEAELEANLDKEGRDDELVITRLETSRDRLLAKRDHLELKLDIMHDRRERLQEALEAQREALNRLKNRVAPEYQTNTHPHIPHTEPATSLQDERKKILHMIQEGKITAEEAMKLLDALQQQEDKSQKSKRKPRWVRIRVTDLYSNRLRVNLTLPVGLVRAGLRSGGNIAGMDGFDTEGLEEMLNRGEVGYLLDVTNDDESSRVEIFVE